MRAPATCLRLGAGVLGLTSHSMLIPLVTQLGSMALTSLQHTLGERDGMLPQTHVNQFPAAHGANAACLTSLQMPAFCGQSP